MSTGLTRPAHPSSLGTNSLPCIASTTLLGTLLLLVAGTIVLSLIPLYIATHALAAEDSYSPLVNRKYILPRSLVANLSKNMMTLRLGLISSDRLKLLEAILQNKLSSTHKFHALRIDLEQATVQSHNARHGGQAVASRQLVRTRRLANEDTVIIAQDRDNATAADQLQISFRLARRGFLTQSLITSALDSIFDRIECNVTTFLALFGSAVETNSTNPIPKLIAYHVKDNELVNLNGVRIFALKDHTGNVQSVYAIQTANAIYTIRGRRLVRIQSAIEALIFNYDDTEDQYRVLVVAQNASYEIPVTYPTPNITFPKPFFDYPLNESVPDIFTGVLLELNNTISSRPIEDATVLLNYIDASNGNKSVVMLNTGGGRYYVPLPTNDTLFDKYFDGNKLFATSALQSAACLQLLQATPIADICSRVADAGKNFCFVIAQEMTVTILGVLRTTSLNISRFQWQAQSFGQLTDLEAVVFVPGEASVRIPLNASNQIPTTIIPPANRTVRRTFSTVINPAQLSTFTVRIVGTRGQCNEQTVAGGSTPDDRIIDVGKANTTVKFSYETYTVKDRIDVYYKNKQIFSTGCVGASGNAVLALDDSETTFRVNVIPNCAGNTDTAWFYSFQCPNELICEDTICYCGISRARSVQFKRPEVNGCGGNDGGVINHLIQANGLVWGFFSDCNKHDECYDTCNSYKLTCDIKFWTSMLISCLKFLPFPGYYPACASWANIYYIGVSLQGTPYFHSGQRSKCKCATSG